MTMLTHEEIVVLAAAIGAPKLLIKLIDAIQKGVGTATAPYFTRKNAEALADGESYRIKKLVSTMEEVKQLGTCFDFKDGQLTFHTEQLAEGDLDKRYLLRTEFQGAKKQQNVENVTSAAVEELLSDPEVESYSPEEPLDADWISKFFSAIEDVSDEEMQRLWGKVLAGEVKQPKSFGLRTLEFLKTLSKTEAEVFAKVAQFSAIGADKEFIGDFQKGKLLEKFNVSFLDILLLKELGILLPETLMIKFFPKEHPTSFTYQGHIVVIEHDAELGLQVLVFSRIGAELLHLLPNNFNAEYLKSLVEPIQQQTSSIWYGKITAVKPESISYENEIVLYKKEPA
jgi:uncharacterized repeat protein (TIGR03899 family)